MKKLIYIALFFACVNAYAQSEAQKETSAFHRNFIAKFTYPRALRNLCVPTFANLKIEVAKDGSVQNIEISDSAPQVFKEQFDEIKSKLNLDLLKPVITANKLKSCNIIIPVFYTCEVDSGNTVERVKQVFNNYFLFKGKPLDKMAFNLEPIAVFMYKPRE
jgi:hypothetical protein